MRQGRIPGPAGRRTPGKLYARAYRNAALNITAAVAQTLIVMDTIDFDPSSIFNTGTGRATIPSAGYYRVSGVLSFQLNNAVEEMEVSVYVNATQRAAGRRDVIRSGLGADIFNYPVSDLMQLAAGDVVDLRADHLQGSNACAIVGGIVHTYLAISKLP